MYFLIGVLAVSAAGVWYLWQRPPGSRVVYVAATDLPAYHQITSADIRKAEIRTNQVRGQATADPADLLGHYTLTVTRSHQPFDLNELGPKLPLGALATQLVVGLSASISDVDGGVITRGDRIDILLSSTAAQSPRNGLLPGAIVLDVKPSGKQAQQVVIVCAFPEKYESILLTAGGTARIFIALVPPVNSH